jgi:hypothetical protein
LAAAVAATAAIAAAEAAAGASRGGEYMKGWSKGDRVVQATYGAGTLVEVNEHHTVIDFDEHGRRTFASRLVVLQATNEPAPNKPSKSRAKKKKVEKADKSDKAEKVEKD